MATNNYTTKTAALRATKADINKLDAKKLLLNGKNILDYISDSEFNSYDTRDPQLKNDELDIWNTEISLSEEGHIEVKPLEHTDATINSTQIAALQGAVKIINNEVFGDNDEHIMYWQTGGLTTVDNLLIRRSRITSFESNLDSLTKCYCLLIYSGIVSFDVKLDNLSNGEGMFCYCSKLTSFTSDLPSLTNGLNMFNGCKLDAPSVANIVHTIKDTYTEGFPPTPMTNITIGIGCDATEEDQLLFAQECDCETWEELLDDFALKNWYVEFQCNGRPTTTYNMRRGETLPIYAKLEEVSDEKYYQYTSTDGSKFYNIHYFHSTNGSTEGYDVFSSLEEAISTYNVTPKN